MPCGYGLDIAFNEKTGAALVTYTGPSLPSIVRRYECVSAEEAATMWEGDWAEPLISPMIWKMMSKTGKPQNAISPCIRGNV